MMSWLLHLAPALGATLAGTVVDADGNKVEGAYVVAYDQRYNYDYDVTGTYGAFFIEVPANNYRLRLLPPSTANFEEVWVGGSTDVCSATVYPLAEDTTENTLELVLTEGAIVAGSVVDPDGEPVEDVLVIARPVSGDSVQSRYGYSDASGEFSVPGLPAGAADDGAFLLELEREGFPDQYLGETYDDELSEEVFVVRGETTDVGLQGMLEGILVGGAVDTPDGPVADGVSIQVYSNAQVITAVTAEGRYEADGLPPGEVLSWGYAPGYAMTYYPDADRAGDREEVLEEGAVYEDLDLYLPTESTLSGTIAGSGDLSGVTLLFYNDNNTVGLGEGVEEDGSFVIDRLHPGDYRMYVYAADEGYLNDYVRDETGEPVWFTVAAGDNALEEPLELAPGNQISGVVTAKYTGEAIYGAYVLAQNDDGDVEGGTTDETGAYDLTGLPDGRWELSVSYTAYCDNDQSWVSVYYEQTVSPSLGGAVTLEDGSSTTWNPVMPPDADQDGMDDVWEEEVGLDPERDDGLEDPDEDGYTNLDEYVLGSDPLIGDVDELPPCGCRSTGAPRWALSLLIFFALRRRRD